MRGAPDRSAQCAASPRGAAALVVQTKGAELSVSIDGKAVGAFKSPGIAHDAKSLVSLTTNAVDVHYDDFSIKAAR